MEETPLNEDDLSTEYPAMAEDEEEEEDEEEDAAPAPAPRAKRARPAGSRNKALDVYTALLDRMTQLEETINRRHSESSTGGTLETPPPVARPKGRPGQGWQLLHQKAHQHPLATSICSWSKFKSLGRQGACGS